VVSPFGQRVSSTDKLYLAEHVPTLIVWGERDRIIPVEHRHSSHERVPGSRFEVFEQAGHFPQLDDPERFCLLLSPTSSRRPSPLRTTWPPCASACWRARGPPSGAR